MSQEGVPLGHYIDHHPNVGVLLTCLTCHSWESYEMSVIVERLKAHRINPENFPITKVSTLAKRPCKHCGKVTWESRPQWPYRPPVPIVKASNSPLENTSYNAAKPGYYD